MTGKNFLFTSESVTEGHPDKVCDQISDAILDEFLAKDKHSRVAAETTVTTGMALVCGEITADCYVDTHVMLAHSVCVARGHFRDMRGVWVLYMCP